MQRVEGIHHHCKGRKFKYKIVQWKHIILISYMYMVLSMESLLDEEYV